MSVKSASWTDLTAASFHLLRPSDLERITSAISESANAWAISIKFAAFLRSFETTLPVDLDEVTVVSAELASIGLWKQIDISHFKYVFGPMLDRAVRERFSKTIKDYEVSRIQKPDDYLDGELKGLGEKLGTSKVKSEKDILAGIAQYFSQVHLLVGLSAPDCMARFVSQGRLTPSPQLARRASFEIKDLILTHARAANSVKSYKRWSWAQLHGIKPSNIQHPRKGSVLEGLVASAPSNGVVVVKVGRHVFHPSLGQVVTVVENVPAKVKKTSVKRGDTVKIVSSGARETA